MYYYFWLLRKQEYEEILYERLHIHNKPNKSLNNTAWNKRLLGTVKNQIKTRVFFIYSIKNKISNINKESRYKVKNCEFLKSWGYDLCFSPTPWSALGFKRMWLRKWGCMQRLYNFKCNSVHPAKQYLKKRFIDLCYFRKYLQNIVIFFWKLWTTNE